MVAVEAVNAFFAYKERAIFKNLNFTAGKGEIFCLLGPNGCGKTTLLDCILGLHALKSGTIQVMGRDNRQVKPHALARSLAYVPQSHEKAFPYTVKEIVIMGRAAYLNMFASPSRKDGMIAEEALELLNIAHLSGRRYTQLSGGETQLVMIARALAQQSPIIVMDEPTAHLDFRHELIILEMITRLVKDRKLSIIMATHFPNHAFYFQNAGVKTTAALLHNTGFLAMGPPEEVVDENAIRALYGVDAKVICVPSDREGVLNNIIPLRTANCETDSVRR
jgi:iron complex transport system ATP-binding protein